MKKIVTGIMATALVVSIGTMGALAAGYNFGRGRNYVDVNNDNLCDNYNSAVCATYNPDGKNYVDTNGDGVCDNHITCVKNYVDVDGDGICDNYIACGKNYVDLNGDGVCDNQGNICKNGMGSRKGLN